MIDVFLSVFIVLVVVGLLVWGVRALFPQLPPQFQRGIDVLSTLFVAFYVIGAVLSLLGYWHAFPLIVHRG
jgi:flagellar biogenesis protein FliO